MIEVKGEALPLSPNQGLGLSLILHELGTNAAKYGALSHDKGPVHVSWRVADSDQGRRVRLRWEERGGPPIEAPGKRGFGLRLIERACTQELKGQVELDCMGEGLRCEIAFPLG